MSNLLATPRRAVQKRLFDAGATGSHGTFLPNYKTAVHRWYPYIEGFSAEFVQGLLDEFGSSGCEIYDPFAGTGTTVTVAATNGLLAYYSEINPFMRLVIESKTNALRHVARRKPAFSQYLDQIHDQALQLPTLSVAEAELRKAFGERPFFVGRRLREIISLKQAVQSVPPPAPAFLDVARVALASIAVGCSEMKRASDLRYRTPSEALSEDVSPLCEFRSKCEQMLADISPEFRELPATTCLSPSALTTPVRESMVDLVITSPPYLNGTNYFRNTKIELWLAGMLHNESELGSFRDEALAAGINDISRRGRKPVLIPAVEEVAGKLDAIAYDRRIPEMVRRYFSDSQTWIGNIFSLLRAGGTACIDIGDSRFAGIHVPVDDLLELIGQAAGFRVAEKRTVRARKSKDGHPLKQVLLVLQKPAQKSGSPRGRRPRESKDYRDAAIEFGRTLPHAQAPYASRNWGHGLHSLCSYQGKLKPAIAHCLVDRFSSPGQCVLDPFSGCGTIPLEAFLQGRIPLGNDLQQLGFILTRAKVERGRDEDVYEVRDRLLQHIVDRKGEEIDDKRYSDFGFNGKIHDYYHAETMNEILAARDYLRDNPCTSWGQAVVYSALLHILHGNRPYALSRCSHPVTPFKPTGNRTYRALAPRLNAKLGRVLGDPVPTGLHAGTAILGSYEALNCERSVDVVITSPPFAASTRFFSSNWLRLWMAGWEPEDFRVRPREFLEHRQKQSMDVYQGLFQAAAGWLRPGGRLIIHAGRTARVNMADELAARAGTDFELVYRFDEDVAGREKFGVRDQGATTCHQYLFFRRMS